AGSARARRRRTAARCRRSETRSLPASPACTAFSPSPGGAQGQFPPAGKAPRAFRAALTTPRAGGEVSAPMIHAVETFVVGLPLWGLLVAIAVALFALGKGADLVVEEAVTLATRMGVSKVVIGATVVSL